MNKLEKSLKAVDEFKKDYLAIQKECEGDGSPTCEDFIQHLRSKVFAIKDRFHPSINGDKTPEVRSDNPAFSDRDDFMAWCKQHGAESSEIYVIQD